MSETMAPNDFELATGEVISLLTPSQFAALHDGAELIAIDGERVVKGRDEIDGDTRFSYLAFGLLTSLRSAAPVANSAQSPAQVPGKAGEMPEWVATVVQHFRTPTPDGREPSYERAVLWFADDRERLLDRVEGLERSVKYYSGLTRHLDKDNASR